MILDFNKDELRDMMKKHNIPKQTRKSLLGMMDHFQGRQDAIVYLESQGIVKISWDYCCPCGACDPEPLVFL